MKSMLIAVLVFVSSAVYACGGGSWEEMRFYNLFLQTNISAEEFYPFLRDADNNFYRENNYYGDTKKSAYPKGNLILWNDILENWSTEEIGKAVYESESFDWSQKQSKIEKSARVYIEFAKECGEAFSYRAKYNSWDYDEILAQKTVDTEYFISKANSLLSAETNPQLKARYYYQIVRILHYSENWSEAIDFYETKVVNKLPKDEIYYYITDQVAGCYYSVEQYDQAAYLFTKVLNKSIDRKKSAFLSFNFCSENNADGKSFFEGIEDEKDFLLIKSLRNFSDEISNVNKFVVLDANDQRVELLFMRALNNVERTVWTKGIGVGEGTLPSITTNKNYDSLLVIAERQIINQKVENRDFWRMASSYLSFIKQDVDIAVSKLEKVKTFEKQKSRLSVIYQVFSWNTISLENENFIAIVLENNATNNNVWEIDSKNDFRRFILDKIAHTYYENNDIAKAFLVHNTIEETNHIHSLELLDELEKLNNKPNKSDYELKLIANKSDNKDLLDYINYQKGIYYLYHKKPEMALEFFNRNNSYEGEMSIPNTVFSNNTKECFGCDVAIMMNDEVYKAKLFSFIKPSFSRKDLANHLVELKRLTKSEKQWKAKLAYYLLANYYYNISNSGYYRGLLTDNTNSGNTIYMDEYQEKYSEEIIANRSGYNLSDIRNYEKYYFALSDQSKEYYQKVIDLSTDKELNAKCLYLIAKCELNDYYNNGSYQTYSIPINKYYDLELVKHKSFSELKAKYSDTQFHKMIIKECSYFRYYSAVY